MNENNLFSNNAGIKFPLIDTHTEDIPNDIIVGLSLCVPSTVSPALTGIYVGLGFVFVVFEDANTGDPIADIRIDNPVENEIYRMNCQDSYIAFISFGPGAISREGYAIKNVVVALEAEVVINLPQQTPAWDLEVRGLSYTIDNILRILSDNDLIKISIENDVIYIDRDDSVLDEASRFNLLDRGVNAELTPRLYTIGGVAPDINGNINIDVENCLEDCALVNTLEIGRGNISNGEYSKLPLDIYFPITPNPLDPCTPTSSTDPGESSTAPNCDNMYKLTIVNSDAREIGTLYSLEDVVPEAIVYDDGVPMLFDDDSTLQSFY
jgi:hypothetical protein